MEAKAIQRYVGTSPRKMRIVIDLIRGKSVGEAMNILHFQPKHAAKSAEKVLRSAVSNFQNKDVNAGTSTDDLFVKEASVGKNLLLRRFHPRARGNAGGIEKFFSQITIVVEEKREEKKEEAKPAKGKAKARTKSAGKAPAKKKPAAKSKKEAA